MKISIQAHQLRDGINKILTVIDKKNSRPILTNCLINADDGKLELIATDLEVTAKVILRADVNNSGSFCINTKNLSDILRELPDENISLDIDQNKNLLNLNCKNINYSLLITHSDDYPQVSFENSSKAINLKSRDILKIINKTSHAISSDETRVNLNGIYFQQLDQKLRAVAIDGHRLALLDLNDFNSENNVLQDGVIIPKKGINELKKLADTYIDMDFILHLDESFLYASANEEYFLSIRLIAREYPKYQTVIPSKTSFAINLDRNSLYNAVKRIRLLSNEKTNAIKFAITSTELKISANHPSLGHATETIPIDYDGKEMEIGFNAKYMLDTLNVLDVNEIIYEFNNELSPVIVRSDEEENFLGIVMPLKI
ncbi:MAG: DNA polymerase III subunit beta [Bacteriovoracaceae bacterium]|jgi:DNA polymerase-3 subunit beta|nr:DNA polymerase III subunit beta [Bacteriovoracaceae bacterium]|tara:strand:+ start:203 stop:1318 length:1116 start_codon:yes stop_codon:yes gene_type:complete